VSLKFIPYCIPSLFKCDIFYFYQVVQSLCIGRVSSFIYNRNGIKVIESEYRCHVDWHRRCTHNSFRQRDTWTEMLFVHGPYWQVNNTAGEHGLSVASLILSDSGAGDNDQTSNVDNNQSMLNCVVCLDWWKMYARVLLLMLVALSAVIPTSMLTIHNDENGCYSTVRSCQIECFKECQTVGKAANCSGSGCIRCSCGE